jgi:hypothetical protein
MHGRSAVRVRCALAGLMAAGFLAGCSNTPAQPVVVHGLLGGYPFSPFAKLPFHPIAGTVRVVEGTRVVTTVTVGSSGRFVLRLPSGTYRLKGTPLHPWKPGVQCYPTTVRTRAAGVSTKVVCPLNSPLER